jgi:hypothetical protein
MNELTPISIGLTPTGYECQYDPRREYRYTNPSMYSLADFFHISPDALRNNTEKTIWLTKATVEDLLIYQSFKEDHKAVIIRTDDTIRELFISDDEKEIETFVNTPDTVVFINPKLFLPTH